MRWRLPLAIDADIIRRKHQAAVIKCYAIDHRTPQRKAQRTNDTLASCIVDVFDVGQLTWRSRPQTADASSGRHAGAWKTGAGAARCRIHVCGNTSPKGGDKSKRCREYRPARNAKTDVRSSSPPSRSSARRQRHDQGGRPRIRNHQPLRRRVILKVGAGGQRLPIAHDARESGDVVHLQLAVDP